MVLPKFISAIFAVVLPVMISSCALDGSSSEEEVVIEFKEHELCSSVIFQSQSVVKLDSPCLESFIADPARILCSDSLLFVFDRGNNKVVSFNYQGDYIFSTTGLIGHAHNEYVHLQDVALDEWTQEIYLYCDRPYQLLVLDYNLKVKRNIVLNELFSEIAVDSSHFYALSPDLSDASRYVLRSYRKGGIGQRHDVVLCYEKVIPRVTGLGRAINRNRESVYACMPFDNHIHEIAHGRIKRCLALDFKGKWFDYEHNKGLSGIRFIEANDETHWMAQKHSSF